MLKHLACIMDGNRRWAFKQGLSTREGHNKGASSIHTAIDFCLEKHISYLTLYAFSIENIKRSEEEKHYLFEILVNTAEQEIEKLKKKNVHVKFIGEKSLFSKNIKTSCEKIEHETASCSQLFLTILLFYGGKQEIVDTTKRIALKIKKGDLQIEDITPELFEHFLWTGQTPEPELIIRTGGHHRLSNFLPYQSTYSELYFLDCLWPDITTHDLEKALEYFNSCEKKLGT